MKRAAIISIYPFPVGMAATNRIIAYSKAISLYNYNIDIICTVPTDIESEYPSEGNIENIHYIYPAGRTKARYKILRFISLYSGFRFLHSAISTIKYIFKNNKNYNDIIISTDDILYLYLYSWVAKIINAKTIFIFDEYPKPIRHKLKTDIPYWKKFAYGIVLKKVDAYISISNDLKKYYCNIVEKPAFIMPIVIDISRFDNLRKTERIKSICYMGNMELAKDNVDIIVKAFAEIHAKYPEIQLDLYGQPNYEDKNKLMNIIHELKVESYVHFKGRVSSNLVPEILSKSYILVSSQPETKRAKGGFPTKLAEYLCSGTPSILTDVGENAIYVTKNRHCFFVNAGSIDEYVKTIEYILNNYEKAETIAKEGQKYIKDTYSLQNVGKNISDFLSKLDE